MSAARGLRPELNRGLSADCAGHPGEVGRQPEHEPTLTGSKRGRRNSGTAVRSGTGSLARLGVLVCAGLLALAGSLAAQPVTSGDLLAPQVSGSKYYVWGEVRAPGAYSFLAAPDIFELMSAAGGPTENANLRRIVLIRSLTQKEVRVNLRAMLRSGKIIRLSPGDVVIVPTSSWSYFLQGLGVVTGVATLVTLVITVINWVGVQP
jgi:hypothetical protein